MEGNKVKFNESGFCKFCGQAWAIESDKMLTEEQLNEEATWKCKCAEACQARAREEYKKTAETDIDIFVRQGNAGGSGFFEESASSPGRKKDYFSFGGY